MRSIKSVCIGQKVGFFLIAVIVGLSGWLIATPASWAKEIELKMVSFLPPDNAYMVGARSFVEKVNSQLAGKLKRIRLMRFQNIKVMVQPGSLLRLRGSASLQNQELRSLNL